MWNFFCDTLLLPVALAFTLDVVPALFQMPVHVAGVLVVAYLQDHLDPDSPQRRQPDRSAVIDLDHVPSALGDVAQKGREPAGTVRDQQF